MQTESNEKTISKPNHLLHLSTRIHPHTRRRPIISRNPLSFLSFSYTHTHAHTGERHRRPATIPLATPALNCEGEIRERALMPGLSHHYIASHACIYMRRYAEREIETRWQGRASELYRRSLYECIYIYEGRSRVAVCGRDRGDCCWGCTVA